MARSAIHKEEARRYLRTAQFASVGLGVVAVALCAVSIPGVNQLPKEYVPPEAPLPLPPTQPVIRPVVLDKDAVAGLADRMEGATSHKPVEAAAPDPKAGDTGAPPAAANGVEWKYYGPIYDGLTVRALVSIKNGEGTTRQRIMREGAQSEGTRLKTITPESIVVHDDGGDREIRREGGDSSRVSWIKTGGGAGTPPGVPGAHLPGAPGGGKGPGGGDSQAKSLDKLRTRARGLQGDGGGSTENMPIQQYVEEQQKVLSGYPELAEQELKYMAGGADGNQLPQDLINQYTKRGLTPPTNLTPEQRAARDKLLRTVVGQKPAGGATR